MSKTRSYGLVAGVAVATWLVVGVAAAAEHAKISLEVKTSRDQVTANVDQTPPPSGKNPRPVIRAKVGERVQVEYLFTNIYPNRTIEDVVVHFYVAAIGEVGEKELPNLAGGDGPVLETAFDMDFRPGGHAGGRTAVKIDKAGVYLIRVESRETQSDHEHFAAVDLVVEP